MRHPEVGTLLDALLGEEPFAILVPGDDTFGRTTDGIKDRLLGLGLREKRFDFAACKAVHCAHLVDEGAHLWSCDVERESGEGEAADKKGEIGSQHKFP